MSNTFENVDKVFTTISGVYKVVQTIYKVIDGVYVKVYSALIEIAVPTVSGWVYYTGDIISPTWNNYDSSQIIIGGTTSASDIGVYTATFTPKEGYCWEDRTVDTKTVEWVIGEDFSNILQDFEYIENNDGTVTITDWKGTLNGVPGTELVIPDNSSIIL